MCVQVFSITFLMKMVKRSNIFLSFLFHETAIGYWERKKMFQIFADILLVILLEAMKTAGIK